LRKAEAYDFVHNQLEKGL